MITANNLTKRYGTVIALNAVSFVIRAGESVALWGSNGAGKTTALRCLLGVHGFEGSLTVNDIDVQRHGKAARAVVGYVPQEVRFYDMSVQETLQFYARLKKVTRSRISDVLQQVQLEAHVHKRVSALSGGMKQRLALAVALLSDPPILILDEPTANLDVKAQRDFIHTIQQLNQQGKTIVFSSHRFDEVIALANRVLVLSDGELQFECQPGELAERLGLHRWLRIWVDEAYHENTLRVLTNEGYVHSPNGHSVFVQVNENGKIAPLQSLQAAQIPIQDFDLVEGELITVQEENHG